MLEYSRILPATALDTPRLRGVSRFMVHPNEEGVACAGTRVHMQDTDSPILAAFPDAAPGDAVCEAQVPAPASPAASDPPLQRIIAQAVCQAMELATALHRSGQLDQAEDAYRAILELSPGHADANHNLGVIAVQSGHAQASVALFRKALESQPGNRTYWLSLFDAMLQADDVDAAAEALEKKRSGGLEPEIVQELVDRLVERRHMLAVDKLANVHRPGAAPSQKQVDAITRLFNANRLDQLDEVARRARPLTRRFPHDAFGWKALGAALVKSGKVDVALQPLQQAVALAPQDIGALSNLGFALQVRGHFVQSEVVLRLALRYQPDFASALVNLGATMARCDRHEEAIECLERALAIEPDCVPALHQLAHAQEERGFLVQALATYQKVLDSADAGASIPRGAGSLASIAFAHLSICSTLAKLSDFTQVVAHCDRAMALMPDDRVVWEKRLYDLSYHPDLDVEEIFAQFVRWGDRHPVPLTDFSRHDRTPGRRIKIGYVSPDFRRHTSRFYFLPLFENHDHALVELHAYSNVKTEDVFTTRFRNCFDHWHDIRGLTDDEAAAQIRRDGIDILVDGCNHMRDERLGVFMRKPAPIQVTWLGSAWTTGLPMVDYVLFDRHIAPPHTLAREQIVRLPGCFVPFQSLHDTPDPAPPPCLRNGHVTFGYSGRSERLNHHTFRVWGEILRRLPTARLVLDYRMFGETCNQPHFRTLIAAQGVDVDRVTLRNSDNIFEGLHDFDILLDCFPHSGGTMLVDALWMGVPALTLASRPPLGRIGTTFLHNIGLPEWVATSEAEYIDKACAFATDTAMRVELRAGMRQRMLDSRLMDGSGFARGVEAAYRTMWTRFCAGAPVTPIDVPASAGARA